MCAPDVAALVLRGMKTLRVRVERQTETALALAERLAVHPQVETVRYPGFGGLMSFDVRGNARAVEEATRLIVNQTSLGGVTTTMESRHRWEGDRVPESLLRLSVGLEDVDAIWADLEQALAAA
jgi:cystathionine gamma-synthase